MPSLGTRVEDLISRLRRRMSRLRVNQPRPVHPQYNINRSPAQGPGQIDGEARDPKCTIFHLPANVRKIIYDMVLTPVMRDCPRTSRQWCRRCSISGPCFGYTADLSLLSTCGLFYDEARAVPLKFDERSVTIETAVQMYECWMPWQRKEVSLTIAFPHPVIRRVYEDLVIGHVERKRHDMLKKLIKWVETHDFGISAVQILHVPGQACSWDKFPEGLLMDTLSVRQLVDCSHPPGQPEIRPGSYYFANRIAYPLNLLGPEGSAGARHWYVPLYMDEVKKRAQAVTPLRPLREYCLKDNGVSRIGGPYWMGTQSKPGIRIVLPCWILDQDALPSGPNSTEPVKIPDDSHMDMVRLDWSDDDDRNSALNLEFLKALKHDT